MNQCYSDYLRSPKWARIRLGVFARDEYKCQCCFRAAQCVHHRRYTKEVLDGRQDCLHFLISLCNACHEYVEFSEFGTKISDQAQKEGRLRLHMLTTCGIKLESWEKKTRSHSWASRKKKKQRQKKGGHQEQLQSAAETHGPHSKKTVHDVSREAESLRFDVDALKKKVLSLESQLALAIDALRELADGQCESGAGPELMRLWNG
jgi:hypothetical protein